MAHRFKSPRQFAKQGSIEARLIRGVKSIRNQEELDAILARSPKHIASEWLSRFARHFKFVPHQILSVLRETMPELSESDAKRAINSQYWPNLELIRQHIFPHNDLQVASETCSIQSSTVNHTNDNSAAV